MDKALRQLLADIIASIRLKDEMLPIRGGAIHLPTPPAPPCPRCHKETLMVRWQGETLAISCSNPALTGSCGIVYVEERSAN